MKDKKKDATTFIADIFWLVVKFYFECPTKNSNLEGTNVGILQWVIIDRSGDKKLLVHK